VHHHAHTFLREPLEEIGDGRNPIVCVSHHSDAH
jgi:hypothetical protein